MADDAPSTPATDSEWTWQGQEKVTVLDCAEHPDGTWWVQVRGSEGTTWTELDWFEQLTDWSPEK